MLFGPTLFTLLVELLHPEQKGVTDMLQDHAVEDLLFSAAGRPGSLTPWKTVRG